MIKLFIIEIRKNIALLNKTVNLLWQSSNYYLLMVFILSATLGILPPIQIIINKHFIDSITQSLKGHSILVPIMWLAALWLINFTNNFIYRLSSYNKQMLADNVNKYITDTILTQIDLMELSEFDNPDVYNQITKINNEALLRSISILDTVVLCISSFISIIFTIGFFLPHNIFIPIFVVVVMIPILAADLSISSKLHEIYKNRLEKLRLVDALQSLVVEYRNIKEIKVCNLGNYIKNYILSVYGDYIYEDKAIRKKNIAIKLRSEFLELITLFILKAYSIFVSINSQLSLGTITMQIASIDNLVASVKAIIQISTSMYNDNLYVSVLYEFIENSKSKETKCAKKQLNEIIKKIQFENVCFKYNNSESYALVDINLTIDVNKSYLIVGLNGSGKTTLIKLLLNIYQPTSGRIVVDGIDLKEIDPMQYRKKLSAVFQDFIKYPLSVEDNIKFGDIDNYSDTVRMYEVAQKSNSESFINNLSNQYHTILQNEWKKGTELSGGQWQKLAITRSLFARSQILILDEPTASLDPLAEEEVYKNLLTMYENKICILISHRLNTAKFVDRIILLGNNRILEEGRFDELIANNNEFCKLYTVQANSYKQDMLKKER